MALSFEESKKQAEAATPTLMSLSSNATTFASENWTKPINSFFILKLIKKNIKL